MKQTIYGVVFIILSFTMKTSHAGRLENVTLWPNSTIPIAIDKQFSFEEHDTIIAALNEMMLQTNLKFIMHTSNGTGTYVYFMKADSNSLLHDITGGSGGTSLTGYGMLPCPPGVSIPQPIKLNKVLKGTVKHEMMHVLGFNHEQCRSDRNRFVRIVDSNIKLGWEINFMILPNGRDIEPYDFNSILHYKYNTGGKNDSATIIRIDSPADRNFGSRDLSRSDVISINTAYPSRPTPRTPLPKIQFMRVGESRSVRVEANKRYNFFNIPVAAGQVYKIDAFNRDRWKNASWGSSYSADGRRERVSCKRVPTSKFMRMLCDIYTIEEENDSKYTGYRFAINTDNNKMTEFTIQGNGQGFLMFYANDCNGLTDYADNVGSIGVNIYRIR